MAVYLNIQTAVGCSCVIRDYTIQIGIAGWQEQNGTIYSQKNPGKEL